MLALLKEFQSQHADGVCKVAHFNTLLKLKFPAEGRQRMAAMARLATKTLEAEAAEAEVARLARNNDLRAIFNALDTDGRGSIEIDGTLSEATQTRERPRSDPVVGCGHAYHD